MKSSLATATAECRSFFWRDATAEGRHCKAGCRHLLARLLLAPKRPPIRFPSTSLQRQGSIAFFAGRIASRGWGQEPNFTPALPFVSFTQTSR
jgi:hypothetical protein